MIPALTILLIVLQPLAVVAAPALEAPTVRVTASASVEAAVDRAELHLQVQRVSPDSASAREEVDRVSTQILELAAASGIVPEDINAAAIRVNPEYRWKDGERTLIGRRVERSLQLRLSNLEAYPDLISALTQLDRVEITQVSFSVGDEAEFRDIALVDAMALARERAELLAQGFSARLGTVWSIENRVAETGPVRPRGGPEIMAMARSDSAPMPAGTQAIRETVDVVFLLDVTAAD